jgi:high-affinity nickel-transport protein
LGIAAVEAGKGLPVYDILIFPLLFTAGMSLIDTADGIMMLGAYGWAFVKPMRKLYYNMVITLVSVLVALIVGGIEAAAVIADQLRLHGGVWDGVKALSDNFGTVGFVIIGVFVASWAISTAIYKLRRYDEVEIKPMPWAEQHS